MRYKIRFSLNSKQCISRYPSCDIKPCYIFGIRIPMVFKAIPNMEWWTYDEIQRTMHKLSDKVKFLLVESRNTHPHNHVESLGTEALDVETILSYFSYSESIYPLSHDDDTYINIMCYSLQDNSRIGDLRYTEYLIDKGICEFHKTSFGKVAGIGIGESKVFVLTDYMKEPIQIRYGHVVTEGDLVGLSESAWTSESFWLAYRTKFSHFYVGNVLYNESEIRQLADAIAIYRRYGCNCS